MVALAAVVRMAKVRTIVSSCTFHHSHTPARVVGEPFCGRFSDKLPAARRPGRTRNSSLAELQVTG